MVSLKIKHQTNLQEIDEGISFHACLSAKDTTGKILWGPARQDAAVDGEAVDLQSLAADELTQPPTQLLGNAPKTGDDGFERLSKAASLSQGRETSQAMHSVVATVVVMDF